jgi:formylglycine-generating enzyme required for sulfatase activity
MELPRDNARTAPMTYRIGPGSCRLLLEWSRVWPNTRLRLTEHSTLQLTSEYIGASLAMLALICIGCASPSPSPIDNGQALGKYGDLLMGLLAFAEGTPLVIPEGQRPTLTGLRSDGTVPWEPIEAARSLYNADGVDLVLGESAVYGLRFPTAESCEEEVALFAFPIQPQFSSAGTILGALAFVVCPGGQTHTILEVVRISAAKRSATASIFWSGGGDLSTITNLEISPTDEEARSLGLDVVQVTLPLDIGPCGICSLLWDFAKNWGCGLLGGAACAAIGVGTAGVGGVVCVALFAVLSKTILDSGLSASQIDASVLCTPATRSLGLLAPGETCPSSMPNCILPIPGVNWNECTVCKATYGCLIAFDNASTAGVACLAVAEAAGGAKGAATFVCGQVAKLLLQESQSRLGTDPGTVCAPLCVPICGDHWCGIGEELSCATDCQDGVCPTADGGDLCFGDGVCTMVETCHTSPEDCACPGDQACLLGGWPPTAVCSDKYDCVPGSVQECKCTRGAVGTQKCEDEGIDWRDCICQADDCEPDCEGAKCGDGGCPSRPDACGQCQAGEACLDAVCVEVGCWPECTDDMVEVPGGPFWMGCNPAGPAECYPATLPQHLVDVPAFLIDKTEVTVDKYAEFVEARQGSWPVLDGDCYFSSEAEVAFLPVNCVDSGEARDYCVWRGKRLCTEAEWEKAARGGCELHGTDSCAEATPVYPWGNEQPSCDLAVMSEEGEGFGCMDEINHMTAPVGSRPAGASPYGLLDMGGNVEEWVEDCWHADFYGAPTDGSAWTADCLWSGQVAKGGSWATTPRADGRTYDPFSTVCFDVVGFRCCAEVR